MLKNALKYSDGNVIKQAGRSSSCMIDRYTPLKRAYNFKEIFHRRNTSNINFVFEIFTCGNAVLDHDRKRVKTG